MSDASDQRPSGPSLPGLRDILSPASATSSNRAYGSTWRAPTSVPPQAQSQYASSYVHPPMVLEPRTQPPHNHRPRSWEVPIHPRGPEAAQAPQPVPQSPYASYSKDYGPSPDSHYERTSVRSAAKHFSSGIASPYNGVPPEGSPFGSAASGFERSQYPTTPNASAEDQKKYLGVKDVPGEGTYHFYEGGYRIPTHVDGEHVNPAWGLTKANKPRKRLALACLDCREKKIKCEPGATSCLQCEKAKRPCRRYVCDPARIQAQLTSCRSQLQQSQGEVGTATDWSPNGPSHSRNKASISDPTPAPAREVEPEIVSKRRSREDPSPPNVPYKKHRSASPLLAMAREAPLPVREGPDGVDTTKIPGPTPPKGAMSVEVDPYEVEPDTTLRLLYLYFAHFNSATYCLYPRQHFMQWLAGSRDKCQNERMMLYAILAVGTLFADESMAGFGRRCARVAADALPQQSGTIHMCTAQARTLLALYSFARGEHTAAWHHSGAAIRAVQYLRYNTEQACLEDSTGNRPRREFNLSAVQHAECKRRTFWSAFLMDRFSQSPTTLLKPQDVFLRLPCTEDMYERSLPSDETPYLNNGIIDPLQALLTAASPLAPMAWLVLVASIWGDVVDLVFRAPYQSTASYREAYVEIWNRLQGWLTRLPEYLQYSTSNLHRSIQQGYASTFVSIHALYHLCCMKLNRCLRHATAQDLVSRNIRAAHEHGHQMLQLMCAVNAARCEINTPTEAPHATSMFSTPFAGYATLVAVDIVSAGGTDSALGTTLEEVKGGLICLRELAKFWDSANDQARLCERRYYQIQNIVTHPLRARGGAWLGRKWGLEKPLEQDIPEDCDCIYGLGDSTEASEVYFDALGDHTGRSKASTGSVRIT